MTQKVKQYKVELEVNDEVIKSKADTLEEAILGVKPTFYKTKGVITVKFGGLKASQLLVIHRMKRFFSSDLARIVLAKNLKLMLK